jgi:glutamyl-tRNA synthetase
MNPLRLSIVGALRGPHLFDIMEIIGKKESLERIAKHLTGFINLPSLHFLNYEN